MSGKESMLLRMLILSSCLLLGACGGESGGNAVADETGSTNTEASQDPETGSENGDAPLENDGAEQDSTGSDTGSNSSTGSDGNSVSDGELDIHYDVGRTYAPAMDYESLGGTGKQENYRVIGYYMPSLDGSFPPSAIGAEQANMLTHINFAFIGINEDLECDFVDGANESATINVIAQLQTLKQHNPDLKTLFSIGGWAESNDNSPTVDRYRDAFKPANQEHFAESCVDFMQQHGFDGIDIDWEYPRSEDVDNFITGLETVNEELAARGFQDKLVTIAGAGGAFFMSRYYHKLPQIVEQLDFINLMSYDLNGPWQGVTETNFHAHLYGNDNEPTFYNALREASLDLTWEEKTQRFPSPFRLTVDAAIRQHLLMDIPRSKLVMGTPFYGRAFFNTGNSNNGLYQTFDTPKGDPYEGDPSLLVGCTPCEERGEPRIATYKEIIGLKNGDYGYTYHFDDQTKAPWLYNEMHDIFLTYEDTRSLKYKTDYIKAEGLGGVMFWHLGQDDDQFTMLTTLHDELNGTNSESITAEDNTPKATSDATDEEESASQ